jgi:competence protein ComEA
MERSITRITSVLPQTAQSTTSHTEKSAGVRIVNLNTATIADLEQLPRVGHTLALRIIAYRDSVGRYSNVDALRGVKGVGPALLEQLRPYLRAP